VSILLRMLRGLLQRRVKNYPLPQVELSPVYACHICGREARPFDRLDFNKSCEEEHGTYLPESGTLIDYFRCEGCGFCFAPAFQSWTRDDFLKHIYNTDYIRVDPDYKWARPYAGVQFLNSILAKEKNRISHLDYGGGTGVLTRELKKLGWNSESYDPFVDSSMPRGALRTYDLVTAFEVFEHVPDVNALVADLIALTKPGGMILFTTLVSDGQIQRGRPLEWWYAAPRNGHVSLFSSAALTTVFGKAGFTLTSFSPVTHAAFQERSEWANMLCSLIKPNHTL
jgi:SAM-dependent methyltransferase